MHTLQNKHKTIVHICEHIAKIAGTNYFEPIDFWDADMCAIGLKKGSKLIYISTLAFKNNAENEMKYYAEFEIVDEISLMTVRREKCFDEIAEGELLEEIKRFLEIV